MNTRGIWLLLAVLLAAWGSLDAQTALSVVVPPGHPKPNATITVNISISRVQALKAAGLNVAYDTTVLRFNAANQGTFIPGGDQSIFLASDPAKASGSVYADQAMIGKGYKSGSGILCSLEFVAVAPGSSPITILSTTSLRDTVNANIPFTVASGSVTVDPLTVQIANFRAACINQDSVLVQWETLSELNNKGFEVQRSLDSRTGFSSIPGSFQPGYANTQVQHAYSYINVHPWMGVLYYRLRQISLDSTDYFSQPVKVTVVTSVAEPGVPSSCTLFQNYPNPFNPATTIPFSVDRESTVRLAVYNSLGQEVARLVDGRVAPGLHAIGWSPATASGVYLCKIEIVPLGGSMQRIVQTKRMVYLR